MAEVEKKYRQTIVDGMAPRMDNLCVREEQFDEPDIEKIVRSFVCNECSARKSCRDGVEIDGSQMRQPGSLDHGVRSLQQRPQMFARHGRQQVDLATGGNTRMTGQDLFDQGRAGAKHAANEQWRRWANRRRRGDHWLGEGSDQAIN